jgi:hypothetical protein
MRLVYAARIACPIRVGERFVTTIKRRWRAPLFNAGGVASERARGAIA